MHSTARSSPRFAYLLAAVLISISSCKPPSISTLEDDASHNERIPPPSLVATSPATLAPHKKLMSYYDANFDAELNLLELPFQSPGYHSNVAHLQATHPIRESLVYALGLIQRGNSEDVARSERIIRQALSVQDTNEDSKSYGTWPWHWEEPLEKMSPPDLNWADFCGATLIHTLRLHPAKLSPALKTEIRQAVRHASRAIRDRNVGPAYTNIAVLGGVVCVASGEELGDSELVSYGRDRLEGVLRLATTQGGFEEYNSPPYAKVVIAECERGAAMISDPATRGSLEQLRSIAWKMAAQHFHPATQQWAGPQARNSKTRLRTSMVEFLSTRLDADLIVHPKMAQGKPRGYAVVPPLPCPHRKQFFKPKSNGDSFQQTYRRADRQREALIATTWFGDDAVLSSINQSSFWTQRKPLLGYLKTEFEPAVVARLQFLKDGHDFASMGMRSTQKQNRILVSLHSIPDRGARHRSLDRPNDGQFRTSDLRVRFSLDGENVQPGQGIGEGWELHAKPWKFAVHSSRATFAGRPVRWETGEDENGVWIDGICYAGDEMTFNFSKELEIDIPIAIELSDVERTEPNEIQRTPTGWSWKDLSLAKTRRANN